MTSRAEGTYNEVQGDLLELFKKGKFQAIAHGCNCFKSMGAGIARTIANEYKRAYLVDVADRRTPLQRLGDLTLSKCRNQEYIFNLYSQYRGGANLDYEALTLCLRKMSIYCAMKGYTRIGLPQIGCGIAGGDWEVVRDIIKRELISFDVTVVIYNK